MNNGQAVRIFLYNGYFNQIGRHWREEHAYD